MFLLDHVFDIIALLICSRWLFQAYLYYFATNKNTNCNLIDDYCTLQLSRRYRSDKYNK